MFDIFRKDKVGVKWIAVEPSIAAAKQHILLKSGGVGDYIIMDQTTGAKIDVRAENLLPKADREPPASS